jgi:predicted O-linked N-acetylglucosamine transferase (SPINDLY family)
VANWPVAKVKVNLVRRLPLLTGAVDAAMYVDSKSHKIDDAVWKKRDVPTYFVQEGVEIAAAEQAASQRSAFGIPEQSVVLSTVTDVDAPLSSEFVEAVVQILRQHTHAVLLVAGEADTAALKRRLDAAGLGKRCGFAGKRKDVTEFLKMADVYVAPIGQPNTAGILAAMAAGRAVVATAGEAGEPQRPQAFIGDDAVAHDQSDYVEKVGKLLRDPALRAKAGEDLKSRVKNYSLDQTAKAIEKLCRDLLETAGAEAPTADVSAKQAA